MPRFLYDWLCPEGHLFEERADCELREIPCRGCSGIAKRQFNVRALNDQFVLINSQWFNVSPEDFRDPNPDPDSLVPKKYNGFTPKSKSILTSRK